MPEIIQFVKNYDDLSTDRGYQFKFYCDHCGNGYMSSFQASMLGMASGLLNAAGSIFGGVFGRAGHSAYQVQQAIGGKAHDDALKTAVTEIKHKFKQCSRCGKWVCPEVCWNEKRNLCEDCAPDLAQETAAAQAHAAKDQVHQKARETNLVEDVDMKVEAAAGCPSCGARVGASKFCPECGTAINAKAQCKKCGAEMAATVKFCPECGERRKPTL
ncbi:MAG: zinc ribbon domain-containing protein [Deltaproteobacteria bacterium]|nr:zinc ribbon domain-containing protein [Deltaproteobacteria bacterium]